MSEKKCVILHPFLFALFPVLHLWAYNINQTSASEVVLPAIATVLFALSCWLLVWAVVRNKRKAALVVSLFLFLFFSHGHFHDLLYEWRLHTWGLLTGAGKTVLMLSGVVLVVGTIFCLRARGDLHKATKLLNVLSGCLVALSLFNIVIYSLAGPDRSQVAAQDIPGIEATRPRKEGALPDIYYIILDRYGSDEVLTSVYGHDNRAFTQYLRDKGFYVATESNANYLKTPHSLASSLNMRLLDDLSKKMGDSDDWTALHRMLRDYPVWRFLKARGYRFVHFGSWWSPTRRNGHADINVNIGSLTEFAGVLYRTTTLYSIWHQLSYRRQQYKRVLYKFDRLAEIPDMPGPTFAFVHMLLPHDPYVFDRSGKFVSEEEGSRKGNEERYIDQLSFANQKVQKLIDTLLAKSRIPPIILLQADEGPFPERYRDETLDFQWEQATDSELKQKMGILNAYYLPGVDTSVLYPSITPVNSFRTVFNLYFGTTLQLLPDTSHIFVDGKHPYRFVDITKRLGGNR